MGSCWGDYLYAVRGKGTPETIFDDQFEKLLIVAAATSTKILVLISLNCFQMKVV
jgi:hypothetical protein